MVEPTHLKNYARQIRSFPQGWKFQKCLSCHHLVIHTPRAPHFFLQAPSDPKSLIIPPLLVYPLPSAGRPPHCSCSPTDFIDLGSCRVAGVYHLTPKKWTHAATNVVYDIIYAVNKDSQFEFVFSKSGNRSQVSNLVKDIEVQRVPFPKRVMFSKS